MNNITRYTTLLLMTVITGMAPSCTKTFLNKEPEDQISTAIFYKSAADAAQGLTGVYNLLTYGYNGYQKVYLDDLTDNAYSNFDRNNERDLAEGNYAATQGIVNTVWQSNYQGIAQCNLYIANVTPIAMDSTTKNEYLAEVRFLRAFFYFNLVNRYGDVILLSTAPTLAQATAQLPRTPKAQVLTFIENDLDFAISNLPDAPYTGHVVKGSALALRAKVALFNQDWATAATLTNEIIAGGNFSLYPDYQGLFFRKNQDNNPEILFSTNYLAPNDQQAGADGGLDIEIGWWMGIDPYQSMVDSYETTAGKPITDPTSGYDPANPLANRDPRLHASIRANSQPWYNPDGSLDSHDGNTTATGYQMIKYIDSTLLPMGYGHTNDNDEDVIHIRYADVLLMYAEAKNELSGPDATIYNALNLVRARVNMPGVDQTVYGDQTSLRAFIRHERRIELAFEGDRYDDIIRWQIADSVMPAVQLPAGGTVTFVKPTNYLWPLPQSELVIDSALKQNTGY